MSDDAEIVIACENVDNTNNKRAVHTKCATCEMPIVYDPALAESVQKTHAGRIEYRCMGCVGSALGPETAREALRYAIDHMPLNEEIGRMRELLGTDAVLDALEASGAIGKLLGKARVPQ